MALTRFGKGAFNTKIGKTAILGALSKTLLAVLCFVHVARVLADDSAMTPLQHFRDCDVCSEMVVLPAGEYMMGATEEEFAGIDESTYRDETPRHSVSVNDLYKYDWDEIPRHPVSVKSFAIAKFDVTRQQFAVFAKETGFKSKGCHIYNGFTWLLSAKASWQNPGFEQTGQDPVVCVSWNDAQAFIAWLNLKQPNGVTLHYRLPTEEEWEYAARAGTVTANYWGDDPAGQCKYANARDISARDLDPQALYVNCRDGYAETSPVGSFLPNAWGLYDMLGDAEQWVSDCSHATYLKLPPAVETYLAQHCNVKTVRGSGWPFIPIGVRLAFRSSGKPDSRSSDNGFRLVVDLTH